MRRLGIVRLDAVQFHGLQSGGLPSRFFLQSLDSLSLIHNDRVELLQLVFKMRDMRFDSRQPFRSFVVHGNAELRKLNSKESRIGIVRERIGERKISRKIEGVREN